MSTDPTPPAPGQELTRQHWEAAAARAAVRDRTLLEEAFAGIELTDDIRRLFGVVIWNLDRDHLLTLASLPAVFRAAAATTASGTAATEAGPGEAPDAARATAATVAAHQRALDEAVDAWRTPGSDHPPDAIVNHASELLDIAAALAGWPVPVVARSGPPVTVVATPPDTWASGRACPAQWLRGRQLLLGYTDLHGIAVLPTPEAILAVIAATAVTVQTETGRVLVLTAAATAYVLDAPSVTP